MELKHPNAEKGQTLNDLKPSQDWIEFDCSQRTLQG